MSIKYFSLILLFIVSFAYGKGCNTYEDNLQVAFNQLLKKHFELKLDESLHWSVQIQGKEIKASSEVHLEVVLEDMLELLKRFNPEGEHKLNYIMVGKSRSLQGTRINEDGMFPRIILKSLNSELLIAFNTHPEERGFHSIEVIRWNGRDGKYQFLHLDFQNKKPLLDTSGQNCMKCHGGENLRPNWGSYKAWGGVLPSRDDMLEVEARHEMYLSDYQVTLETQAYLDLMLQVKKDKKSRLRLIEAPNEVDVIRGIVQKEGFYRIPHYPFKKNSTSLVVNLDKKTALLAGPNQVMFDQLLGQNMCRIANLEKDFFKKYEAHILAQHFCEDRFDYNLWPSELVKTHPDLKSNYLKNLKEILASYRKDHQIKNDQHLELLRDYVTYIQKKTVDEDILNSIQRFLDFQLAPFLPEYNAIADFPGLRGVKEKNTKEIAYLKTLIEAEGRSLLGWSLSQGEKGFHSFSFSDQFELIYENEIFKQGPFNCEELIKDSHASSDLSQ